MKETYDQIKAGAVRDCPLTSDFIRTDGGVISSHELLVLIYQTFGDKPFNIEITPSDTKPQTNPFHREFLSDKLQER
jgi:hypothetical protein